CARLRAGPGRNATGALSGGRRAGGRPSGTSPRSIRASGPADPTGLPTRLATSTTRAGICGMGLPAAGKGYAQAGWQGAWQQAWSGTGRPLKNLFFHCLLAMDKGQPVPNAIKVVPTTRSNRLCTRLLRDTVPAALPARRANVASVKKATSAYTAPNIKKVSVW